MAKLPKEFEGLSENALTVAKTCFSLGTAQMQLAYANVENQCPRDMAEALKELVEKRLLDQAYDGYDRIREVYTITEGKVDAFAALRKVPIKITELRMMQPIDKSKPLDLLPPSWAGSMIGNYRRASFVSDKVTDGMIFARIQQCATMDEDDKIEAVKDLEDEIS